MSHDAYGLLSDGAAMQPLLAALDTATTDADLAPWMQPYAVLFTDLTGFSTHPVLAQALQRVLSMERAVAQCCATAGGTLIKAMGDSHLLLFPLVAQALRCVTQLHEWPAATPFCAGIGYGHVLLCPHHDGRLDVFGLEVSAASRLGEDVASGQQVLLTDAAYAQLALAPALQARCGPRVEGRLPYYLWMGR